MSDEVLGACLPVTNSAGVSMDPPPSFVGDILGTQRCTLLGLRGSLWDWFGAAGVSLHNCCFLPQVHFVPDAGTVAQIVYTDDQVRPPQQVVYTADGASYTSVDGPEHTLVYIHPVEAAQACEWLLCIVCLFISWFTHYLRLLSASHHGGCWYRKYSHKIYAFKEFITSLAEEDRIYLFKLNVMS